MRPASLIGAVIGFSIGMFLFRSLFLGLLFSMIGSSLGARTTFKTYYRSGTHNSGGWFNSWGTGTADGQVFMDSLFSMLGKLAAADGHVSEEEKQLFRNVVINELKITNPNSVASALNTFHQATSSSTPCAEYARQAFNTFGNRRQLLEMMLLIMIRVCAASEGINSQEDKMLREIAGVFGYSSAAYESLRSRYTFGGYGQGSQSYNSSNSSAGGLQNAFEVLGVSASSSESDLRKAYRKKAAEYHPDKIAAKGLPKEFTEFANAKFQEIQKAWDEIREAKGF